MTKVYKSRGALSIGVVALAAISLILGGCSSDDDAKKDEQTADSLLESDADALAPDGSTGSADSTPAMDDTTASNDTQAGAVSWSRAIDIALTETAGAAVVELERDTSGGVEVWELDLLTADDDGVEIKIAVDDGRIIGQGTTRIGSDQRPAPAVTAVDAITRALDEQAGEVREAELDIEDGVRVWEIKIRPADGPDVKCYVDATTGELSQRSD